MRLIDVGMAGMELDAILTESEGELTPEVEARLDAVLAQGKEALESASFVIRRMQTDADFCEREATRMKGRKESIEKAIEGLRARMAFALDGAFNGKIKTPSVTLWMQTSADTLQIELAPDADLAKLDVTDSEFVKKTYALDTKAVRQRYEAGDPIPSAINVTEAPGKRSLRMR